jgi:hypothetical protein
MWVGGGWGQGGGARRFVRQELRTHMIFTEKGARSRLNTTHLLVAL